MAQPVITLQRMLTRSTRRAFLLTHIDMAQALALRSIRARSIIRHAFSRPIDHTHIGMVGTGLAVTIAARWLYGLVRDHLELAFGQVGGWKVTPHSVANWHVASTSMKSAMKIGGS